ncbi:ATP-dependent protease subunit HslV [bacterium]|nr:ATP-dependent protease subunit HslV [bacterium]
MRHMKSTTIIAVKRNGRVAIAGDGQVTFQNTVLKNKARKVRRMYNGKVIAGFAGAAADALALFDRLERKLQEHKGNLLRACVELAKEWRTERALRQLEALLVVSDGEQLLVVSGTGDVIEPDDDVIGIGSGGPYALAAAKALLKYTELSAEKVAEEAIRIASSICIYTNDQIYIETIEGSEGV